MTQLISNSCHVKLFSVKVRWILCIIRWFVFVCVCVCGCGQCPLAHSLHVNHTHTRTRVKWNFRQISFCLRRFTEVNLPWHGKSAVDRIQVVGWKSIHWPNSIVTQYMLGIFIFFSPLEIAFWAQYYIYSNFPDRKRPPPHPPILSFSLPFAPALFLYLSVRTHKIVLARQDYFNARCAASVCTLFFVCSVNQFVFRRKKIFLLYN